MLLGRAGRVLTRDHVVVVAFELLKKGMTVSGIRSKPLHWRRDVRNWLASVQQYQRRYGLDLRRAALYQGQNFPTNALIEFIGRFIEKKLAMWVIKNALQESGAALSVPLDDATLNFMTNLAVDSVLASA